MDKFSSFLDELSKIAVKIPVIHGTSGRWPILRSGIGSTVLKSDPNPRGLYVAAKIRSRRKGIERFAQEAAAAKGGAPTVAHAKIDTTRGWGPSSLTAQGRKNIGDLDEARALVDELETATGPRRGEIWKTLNQGVGAWANTTPGATLKPTKFESVAEKVKKIAA